MFPKCPRNTSLTGAGSRQANPGDQGPRARVLRPGTSASHAPPKYGTGSSLGALEGLAHPAPRSNPKAKQAPPQGGQGPEHAQVPLRTNEKRQGVQLQSKLAWARGPSPSPPRPAGPMSCMSWLWLMFPSRLCRPPSPARQEALRPGPPAVRTPAATAQGSPHLGCPELCGECLPTRASAVGLVHRFTTWRWEHRGGTAERSF